MKHDFVYENAPLIEVIAEIHWATSQLTLHSKLKSDPHYKQFEQGFENYLSDLEFSDVHEMFPSDIPLELTAYRPRKRFRKAPGQWPLAQIGPGLVTVNIVPPYNGWKEFESFLFKVIDGTFKCYPNAKSSLVVEKLHLRYIDGFDSRFGFDQYAEFAKQMLGFNSILPKEFLQQCAKDGAELPYVSKSRFLNDSPDGSIGGIKVAPGKFNDEDALIMEMYCESSFEDESFVSADNVKKWFQDAHRCLSNQFNIVVTPELKSKFGQKRSI